MIDINTRIKQMQKQARATYKAMRSDAHRELVDVTNEIETAFREKGFDASASGDTASTTITLTLQGKQSLKNMRPFLKQLARTRAFGPATYRAAPEYGYVAWTFKSRSIEDSQTLILNVWLGTSVSCKRVATGRMTEEYEVVCDEIPAGLLEI
ncbi:MAG: hypothetical protein GY766_21585 [Herbaspirillum sp.]|uniref:hypothetical protein n=1 Tax=Herbaspirillum sp. TaxID=1890675 RepID=UPI002585D1C9|nr:hypothetical protein [Herbaspirillum sp.]MCP3657449.1 hypothetical protein [Herbaspirillum sp.]